MGGRARGVVVAVVVAFVATVLAPLAVPVPAGAAASSTAPFRSADALVRQQFRDFQGRNATTSEVAPFLPGLADGSMTAAAVVDEIAHIGTPSERNANVTRLYTAYFQRLPDIGGLEYWINKSASGWTLNKISGNFAGSSEFVRKYGSLSNAGFVDRAFLNVFGRAADPGGRTYWINKLNKGMARGAVMVGFSQSNEYQRKQLATVEMVLAYRGLLRKIPTGAEATAAVARVQADGFAALAADLIALGAYSDRFPAPGRVGSLVAYGGDARASLEWKAAAGNGVPLAGYTLRVLKGGVQQGADRTLSADATSIVVTGLTNGQTYTFVLIAFNTNRDGLSVTSGTVLVKPEVVWSTYQGNAAHSGVQPYGTVPATPAFKWEAKLPAPVQQVVVGDERVFAVTSGNGSGSSGGGLVYALDPADGSVLWGPVTIPGGTYGEAFLGYENKKVFASNDDGLITALDSASGTAKWSINLDVNIAFQEGLTVADGSIYTFDEQGLVAINTSNGAIRWHASTMNNSGTPGVDASGIYVSQVCQYAYRFTTAGKKTWSTSSNCSGGGAGVASLGSGRMWSSGNYLHDEVIRDQANGNAVGTPLGGEAPAISGPTVVYNDSQTLRSVEWASGTVQWSQAGDGHLLGAPVINAGRTFIRSDEGKVFSYTLATGAQAWTRDVFNDMATEPQSYAADVGDLAIGDGLLLVPVSVNGFSTETGSIIAYG